MQKRNNPVGKASANSASDVGNYRLDQANGQPKASRLLGVRRALGYQILRLAEHMYGERFQPIRGGMWTIDLQAMRENSESYRDLKGGGETGNGHSVDVPVAKRHAVFRH
jgi:hypothetical protein